MPSRNLKFSLRGILIAMVLIGVSGMIGGFLFTGIMLGAPSTARHRLDLLPFILATAMAPLGVPLVIYWGMRAVDWWERRRSGPADGRDSH